MSPHIKSTKVLTLLSIFAASALALCGLSSNTFAEGAFDPNLKNCILNNYNQRHEEKVESFDALNLDSSNMWMISCYESRDGHISDFSGLSQLGISYLDLSNMGITDISWMSDMTKSFGSLTQLFLANNSIQDISPIYNFPYLVTLNLNNNNLDLSAEGDDLYNKRFNSFPNLRELRISGNRLYSVSFLDLHNLEVLEAKNCGLGEFGMIYAQNLKRIDVSNNSIQSIWEFNIGQGWNLEELNLSNNNIQDYAPIADNLTTLQRLYIDGNSSKDYSVLEDISESTWIDVFHARYKADDVSAHPAFTSGVFYEMVVDSYYYNKYKEETGSVSGFWDQYDRYHRRREILTNEQLASITSISCVNSGPVGSWVAAAVINSTSGIELMPNLTSIDFEYCTFNDPNADFSHNKKLETFVAYPVGPAVTETIDFSQNPELKEVIIVYAAGLRKMDFSNNKKLEKIELQSTQTAVVILRDLPLLKEVYLVDLDNLVGIATSGSDNIEKLVITGRGQESFGVSKNVLSKTLAIESSSLQLREFGGRGGSDDETPVEDEQLVFDISSLDFIQNSNTNVDGTLENETITVKDPACYSYDASAKVVLVKSSCVAAGLKSVTLIHSYTINGTDYTNEFDIDFNLDEDDNEEESEPAPATPNTGLFTGTDDRASSSTLILAILAGLSVSVFTFFTLKKYQKV